MEDVSKVLHEATLTTPTTLGVGIDWSAAIRGCVFCLICGSGGEPKPPFMLGSSLPLTTASPRQLGLHQRQWDWVWGPSFLLSPSLRENSESINQLERKELWILNLVQLMLITYKYGTRNTTCSSGPIVCSAHSAAATAGSWIALSFARTRLDSRKRWDLLSSGGDGQLKRDLLLLLYR